VGEIRITSDNKTPPGENFYLHLPGYDVGWSFSSPWSPIHIQRLLLREQCEFRSFNLLLERWYIFVENFVELFQS
jgi:hypothetical protein